MLMCRAVQSKSLHPEAFLVLYMASPLKSFLLRMTNHTD